MLYKCTDIVFRLICIMGALRALMSACPPTPKQSTKNVFFINRRKKKTYCPPQYKHENYFLRERNKQPPPPNPHSMKTCTHLARQGKPGHVISHEAQQTALEDVPLGLIANAPWCVAQRVPPPQELQGRVLGQQVLQSLQAQVDWGHSHHSTWSCKSHGISKE